MVRGLSLSLLVILFTSVVTHVRAEDKVYENRIYDDLVETVLLSKNSEFYDPVPIMTLGQVNALKLKFDKLQASNEFYQYTIIHCDASWRQSNLMRTEYLEGETMGEIQDYTFSSNTFEQYVQYKLVFPTADMPLTKSGNYILLVYRNFDETDLVLSRRFMVLEHKTLVEGNVKPATNAADRFYKQEVDFEVSYKEYLIQNPFLDVKAVVMQNNSWNNSIIGLRPLFANNNVLSFNYENENVFDGLSEFRFFDIRTLNNFSQNVARKFTDSLVNVVLRPQELRSHLNYTNWIDFNGKRVIQNVDGGDVTENGDYTLVHFTLKSPNEINVGDVYIYGELSDWRMTEKYKMTYYPEKQLYYAAIKLKQSYYNYHYVIDNKETGKMDYAYTEGNHAETENEYTVLIYHRDAFYGYDRLIGKRTLNSRSERD